MLTIRKYIYFLVKKTSLSIRRQLRLRMYIINIILYDSYTGSAHRFCFEGDLLTNTSHNPI